MQEAQRVEFEWVFRSTYPAVLRRRTWSCTTAAGQRTSPGRLRPRLSDTLADEPTAWDVLPDLDLARAIATLSPQQRAAVALFYLEDLPVDEVVQLVDVDGTRVVITASSTPDDDPAETAELVAIATSTHFTHHADLDG